MPHAQYAFTDIACPKCGNKPFTTSTAQPGKRQGLEEFMGRECAKCGHVLQVEEVESALADAVDDLFKERFKGGE